MRDKQLKLDKNIYIQLFPHQPLIQDEKFIYHKHFLFEYLFKYMYFYL